MQPGAVKKAKGLERGDKRSCTPPSLAVWPWGSHLSFLGFQHPCLWNRGYDTNDHNYTLCCCEDSPKYQICQIRRQGQTHNAFTENGPMWKDKANKQLPRNELWNDCWAAYLKIKDAMGNIFSFMKPSISCCLAGHDLDKHLIRATVGQGSRQELAL